MPSPVPPSCHVQLVPDDEPVATCKHRRGRSPRRPDTARAAAASMRQVYAATAARAPGGLLVLNFPPAVRIWLGNQSVDLRRSFDGLAELVRQHLQADPLSGHVFVFRNKRGDRVKLLYWDEDGFVIVYKRLEQGTFRWPAPAWRRTSGDIRLRAAELAMLLDGIDWQNARRARRYHRPATGWTDVHRERQLEPLLLFAFSAEQFRSVYASNSHEPHPSCCRAAANRRANCRTIWPRSRT